MQCQEAQEYVSMLCDGEIVSREAATHITDCRECRRRLQDFAALGAELRLFGSATQPEEELTQVSVPAPRFRGGWVQAWTQRVPVPRFVVVLLVLVAIGSLSIGLVEAQKAQRTEAVQDFHWAVMGAELSKVEVLLREDPSLVKSLYETFSPLHRVGTWIGVDPANIFPIARLLLEAGADVNARSQYWDTTPLHLAAGQGDLDFIKFLLDHGADINAKDQSGSTPLEKAVRGRNPSAQNVMFLLGNGADAGAVNSFGYSILHAVVVRSSFLRTKFSSEIVEMLLDHGAKLDVFTAAGFGKVAVLSEMLVKDPSLARARKPRIGTPLQLAAFRRQEEAVRILLQYDPPMNIFLASATGNLDLVKELLDKDPSLVNATEKGTRGAPLLWAVRGGRVKVAKLLLDRGADVNAGAGSAFVMAASPDSLRYAVLRGDLKMVQFLIQRGARVRSGSLNFLLRLASQAGHEEVAEELRRLR